MSDLDPATLFLADARAFLQDARATPGGRTWQSDRERALWHAAYYLAQSLEAALARIAALEQQRDSP